MLCATTMKECNAEAAIWVYYGKYFKKCNHPVSIRLAHGKYEVVQSIF